MKRTRWLLGAALLALVLIVAPMTVSIGRAQMGPMMGSGMHQMMGQSLDQLSGDDFDKAFLAQMTMHHAMAVMMTRPVVANATHQELKDLGQAIIADQTREIGQMRAWARDWYGLDIPDPVAMMDQMHGQGSMTPGMMQPGMGQPGMGQGSGMPIHQHGHMSMMHEMSMMASMDKLPPQRLEAVFMSQMIPHHQSAIEMAGLVPDRAAHQEVKDLAKGIISSQSAEIDKMNGWLGSWYGL